MSGGAGWSSVPASLARYLRESGGDAFSRRRLLAHATVAFAELDARCRGAENRDMSIAGQAANPASPLVRFLDARLPGRHLVSEDWVLRSAHAPWPGMAVDVDRRKLGLAVEIRVGLDLAARPGYWELLSFLPPGDCESLLRGAGYSQVGYEHLADTGTRDPLLLEWARTSSPIAMSQDQQATLQACWDAVLMEDLVDALAGHSAQVHRSFLAHMRDALGRGDRAAARTDPAVEALSIYGTATFGTAGGSSPVLATGCCWHPSWPADSGSRT